MKGKVPCTAGDSSEVCPGAPARCGVRAKLCTGLERKEMSWGRCPAGLLLWLALSLACRAQKTPGVDGTTPNTPPSSAPLATLPSGERMLRTPHYEIHVSAPEDCSRGPRDA